MELNKHLDTPYGAETKQYKRDGGIVLSPSSITKFFDNPGDWWNDRTGVPTFDGNTATVLGNAVHAAIDAHYDGEVVTTEDVERWVYAKYAVQMDTVAGRDAKGIPYPKVDIGVILSSFQNMLNVWKNEYAELYPVPERREEYTEITLSENIKLAGTFDGYERKKSSY